MNINLIYDTSVNSAPAAFKAALNAVAQFLDSKFTNSITINIRVGYGEIDGQSLFNGALGESETFFNKYTYTQIRGALAQNATSADQIAAVNSLPASDPTNGGNYWVTTANAKALGLMGASTAVDAYIGFASGFPFDYDTSNGVTAGSYDFFGVAAHELTETMGRSVFVGTDGIGANAYTPLDLFHYSANGVRDFIGTMAGYFSIDGGKTNLDSFNINSNGDFGDWASGAGNDSFLAFSNSGVVNTVSQTDLREMNVLGYKTASQDTTAPVLVSDKVLTVGSGSTATITSSILRFTDQGSADAQVTYMVATGPAHGTLLKNGAATSTFTQADIGNGLISYRDTGSNVATDSFTFTVSDLSGNGTASQTFQIQVSRVIEAFGSTRLTQVGTKYLLYNSTGSGPSLQNNGVSVTPGGFGTWTPIGAEAIATGYEVAWKDMSSNQYGVWITDGGGNLLSVPTGSVSGTSAVLEGYEPSFAQDLNGDGAIGTPTQNGVIEAFGSTRLTEVGNQYFLYDSASSGPSLKSGGAAVAAGQFGTWAPIGAEATSTGYEVAWKDTSSNQYGIWLTDSSGNLLSVPTGSVSGTSSVLEGYESSFAQDLNGDNVIGVPAQGTSSAVIEAFGATSLTEVGNQYLLYDSTGSGPSLKANGAAVSVGGFGSWTPIGAEATSTGYEVAWKDTDTDQYGVWLTDSNGNLLSVPTGSVSEMSSVLEAYESSFQQDLNGDDLIGMSASDLPSGSAPVLGELEFYLGAGASPPADDDELTALIAGSGGIGSTQPPGSTELLFNARPPESANVLGAGPGAMEASAVSELRPAILTGS